MNNRTEWQMAKVNKRARRCGLGLTIREIYHAAVLQQS